MKDLCALLAGLTDLCHISFTRVSDKARSINSEATTEWLTAMWPNACKGYVDSDIFNTEKTGIFFRLTSDRTLKFK
jgi:hypothetical protein